MLALARRQANSGAPRVSTHRVLAILRDLVPSCGQRSRCFVHILPRWKLNGPLEEACIVVRGWRGARRPGVGAEVVMVSASGKEEGPGEIEYDLVEPKSHVIERRRLVEVAHVEMDVSDARPFRCAPPGLPGPGAHEVLRVQRQRRNGDRSPLHSPGAAR